MTDPSHSPGPENNSGLLDSQSVTFLALIACPILGLVSAAMGFVFILQDQLIIGLIFILVLAQIFIAGGLWAYSRRKKSAGQSENQQ